MSQLFKGRCGAGVVIAAAMALSPASVRAIEDKPLPAFSVTASDGSAVTSTALNAAPQYVLIYVAPNCRPCDRIVELLKEWKSPAMSARVVFVVAASGANAAAYVGARLPPEAGAPVVYGDESGAAYRALKLTGTPVLIGVRAGRTVWSVSGVFNDGTTVESVVRTWITY